MFNIIRGPLAAALLLGVSLAAAAPVSAAVVGVQLGGVGISVGNGHYYDRNHHVRSYSYPSDWKAYHHPQSWYRSHSSWNDSNSRDYYRH